MLTLNYTDSVELIFKLQIYNAQDNSSTIDVKNKVTGKISELINFRNLYKRPEIGEISNTHFGDSKDLKSLIYALQQRKQGETENSQSFVSRINALNC